eukprot:TRINITY_DN3759_c0_g1_i1.p1 TRINITY_DN3759_c0_g1~~TRINITY_DN3759_c0_g1_i1.p1  ORF type:complete len:213 (-),score=16.13 TRINITY_DN3759_c0_g1_i1:135-773(-)
MVRIGDLAPDFQAPSSQGPIHLHQWVENHWCLLCSHPADYTPVCTTELGDLAKRTERFAKKNCKVLGLSVDSVENHHDWIKDINETQNTCVSYPIVADEDRKISEAYGMLDPTNITVKGMAATVRAVYFIDPNKRIRAIIYYPASCGRNFDEIERVLDSLQLSDRTPVATPVNWKNGDEVIVHPSVSDEKAHELFGSFTKLKPYLRTTKLPQ